MAEQKPKKQTEAEILMARIVNLENLVSKIAVQAGQGNHLAEFNIERWKPGKKDMTKNR